MANKTFSDQVATKTTTTVDATDITALTRDPAGTPLSKVITMTNLATGLLGVISAAVVKLFSMTQSGSTSSTTYVDVDADTITLTAGKVYLVFGKAVLTPGSSIGYQRISGTATVTDMSITGGEADVTAMDGEFQSDSVSRTRRYIGWIACSGSGTLIWQHKVISGTAMTSTITMWAIEVG